MCVRFSLFSFGFFSVGKLSVTVFTLYCTLFNVMVQCFGEICSIPFFFQKWVDPRKTYDSYLPLDRFHGSPPSRPGLNDIPLSCLPVMTSTAIPRRINLRPGRRIDRETFHRRRRKTPGTTDGHATFPCLSCGPLLPRCCPFIPVSFFNSWTSVFTNWSRSVPVPFNVCIFYPPSFLIFFN